jgi:predicted nucleotidyltransferase component of viral defense system
LVQEIPGPIGPVLDAVREAISPWLGRPKVERLTRGTTLVWKFETSTVPVQVSRLKLEINTREHGWVGKPEKTAFAVDNPWFSGEAAVTTVALKDLLATKVRALYQRRKGRDLFDLHVALERFPDLDVKHILKGFRSVMDREGHPVSWRVFELNLQDKVDHPAFASDIKSLLATGDFDPVMAWSSLAPRLQAAWDPA